jgi:pyruvate formate lyase activating enzyme
MAASGYVVEIRRFCVHDGPGIRTTVFLKGCNLRCKWCHNPETLRPLPELQVLADKCIGCGECIKACPLGCHALEAGRKVFHHDRCKACGACAEACYAQALLLIGQRLSARGVVNQVAADREFYRTSGGGLTLSGGEPLFQRRFAFQILQLARREGIHAAIQTNLAWPWEQFQEVLAACDLVMCDIKAMDDQVHREWTGMSNQLVLANLRRLAGSGKPFIVRTPIVPGVNDTPQEIGRIADFVSGMAGLLYYELLSYHPLGGGKYRSLGLEFPTAHLKRPDRLHMQALAQEARRREIPVRAPEE